LLRCGRLFGKNGHHDRGLFSILLLNLTRLARGEALTLGAGVLHAYLEGSGMELMANSNNVIRGGLTQKHVDVPELLRNVTFDAGSAECLHATRQSETAWLYETPFREFALWRIEVGDSRSHTAAAHHSVEIIFVASTDQSVTVTSDTASIELQQGQAALTRHDTAYRIDAHRDAILFKASVPES
jgi:mannose-6-phosphate isomerase class I